MQELIREAYATRPFAKAYRVTGAGNEDVNGLYTLSPTSGLNSPGGDSGLAVIYQKHPAGPDEPLLTLFRCTMRTKSKWWFISQADKDKPGTDKDIDYYQVRLWPTYMLAGMTLTTSHHITYMAMYRAPRLLQHKSNVDEEREPPLRGWNCLIGGTAATVSRGPPPTLERVGEVVPEGVDTSEFLVHRLVRWCLEHDLLSHFFSPLSLRVEVISRSLRLALFLSEADALTEAHVQLMWRAAAQSQDVDIVDEVFTVLVQVRGWPAWKCVWRVDRPPRPGTPTHPCLTVLVQVSWHLRADLFKALIALALDAVTKPADNPAGAFAKASVFAEKFALETNRLGELGDESASLLLSLVWAIYRNPGFDGLKNSFAIQELLSRCFDLKAGAAMAVQRVRECAEALQSLGAKHSSTSVPAGPAMQRVSSSSVSAGAAALPEEELSAARVIHTLQFLISKHVSQGAIETLNAEGFPEVLNAEVKRFCGANGGRMLDSVASPASSSGPGQETQWYRLQLAERLQVLRLFYGVSPAVKVPQGMLEELWSLLKGSPQGLEEFFAFLTRGATGPATPAPAGQHASEAFCDWYACLHIFKTFLCSPDVDWSQSTGAQGFECFHKFYMGLRKAPEGAAVRADVDVSVLPPTLGLDTLWEIVLRLPLEPAAHAATDLLLLAYDTIAAEANADAPALLLQRIFVLVDAALQEVEAGAGVGAGPGVGRLLTRVDRLVGVLEGAISRSKGDAGPPHAVCGSMSRITIRVLHRRATSYINQNTNADVIRGEKGSDGSAFLEVHPLHTVRDLKIKVADRLGYTTSHGLNVVGVGMNSTVTSHLNTGKVLVEKGGDTWRDSCRLRQLGLVDGSDVHMTFIVTSTYALKPTYDDAGARDDGDAGAPHVGAALAQSWERFDGLLALCEALHKEFPKGSASASDAAAAAMKIFDLLVLVPTQPEMLRSVEQLGAGRADPGMHWGLLIDEAHTSLARITYALQIIDNLLQPAPEFRTPDVDARAAQFRSGFIESSGFSAVLQVLVRTPAPPPATAGASTDMNRHALASALSIVHFLLFGGSGGGSGGSGSDGSLEDSLVALDMGRDGPVAGSPRSAAAHTLPVTLQRELQASAVGVAEKLLAVASSAAADESAGASGVVHNALKTITYLIRAPDVASQLISNNPQSRSLLTTVLRSVSKKVREMSADFAIEVGRTQPVVFSWLLAEMETLDPTDTVCSDIFRALGTLVETLSAVPRAIDMGHLGAVLCQRLMAYPRGGAKHGNGAIAAAATASGSGEQQVLTGYLLLLEKVIRIEPAAIPAGAFNGSLVQTFLDEFLFAMPTDEEQDMTPICDHASTRSAAYHVLAAYLSLSPEPFEIALAAVGRLADAASEQIRSSWGLQVSHDVKRPDVTFSGLKNQGCTCYLNSLLQQLFMNVQFRTAILQTTMREAHRTTVWHRQPQELVGLTLMFEWVGGLWKCGKVVHYDAATHEHTVQYEDDTRGEAAATYVLCEGRYQKETGYVRVLPPATFVDEDGETVSLEGLTERDESAMRVLEQLQRTFCFMQFSKRRYFDPRPFVEACKCLNMNFNVYHQNDAAGTSGRQAAVSAPF